MTGRDRSGDEELSRSLEPCLTEKFAYQGHILLESYTANQVACLLKVHDADIGLLCLEGTSRTAGCAPGAGKAMPTGIKQDDVVILSEFTGCAQPGQSIFIEAMQEQQRGLLASCAIGVLVYAVGKEITFAPRCRDELLNGAVGFYNCLQVLLLFVHHNAVYLFYLDSGTSSEGRFGVILSAGKDLSRWATRCFPFAALSRTGIRHDCSHMNPDLRTPSERADKSAVCTINRHLLLCQTSFDIWKCSGAPGSTCRLKFDRVLRMSRLLCHMP